MQEGWISVIAPLCFLVFFPLFWMTICLVTSFVGGWKSLSGKYLFTGNFPEDYQNFIYGNFGLIHYNGVLKTAARPEGFYLGVIAIFRFGHPNLFIPWEEFEEISTVKRLFMGKFYRLKIKGMYPTISIGGRAFQGKEKYLEKRH